MVLKETVVLRDGLLELRFSIRKEFGDSESTVDVVYGEFYIGDLSDFIDKPYPVNSVFSFFSFLSNNKKLAKELNQYLHKYFSSARIKAIDQLWEKMQTGTEITYDFLSYKEKIVVIGPKEIAHPIGNGNKLKTVVVEVCRFINNKKIATTTYWFEVDKSFRLVQWGHDMGKEYHLEVIQP